MSKVFAHAVLVLGILAPAYATAAAPCAANLPSPLPVTVDGAIGDLVIDDACRYVYLSNTGNARVDVYSLADQRFENSITVGQGPGAMDTSPDGSTLYVANTGSGGAPTLSVIDLQSRAETARVVIPASTSTVTSADPPLPFSLAVDSRGVVHFTTGSYRYIQYTPATGVFRDRRDTWLTEQTRLSASGDRSVIGIFRGDISLGESNAYIVAADQFTRTTNLGQAIWAGALDRSGKVMVVNNFVLDPHLHVAGLVGSDFAGGVAVDPDGAIGYFASRGKLYAASLTTFLKTADIPIGDTIDRALYTLSTIGQLRISRDGLLLAAITDHGFSLMAVGAASVSAPPIHAVAFSTLTENQSYLRFYNGGTVPGTVRVKLADFTTGKLSADWTSPAIAPGASPQFPIATLEAVAAQPLAKPTLYQMTISATMPGTFANAVYNAATGNLVDISNCDSTNAMDATMVKNVHGGAIAGAFPSTIVLINTGTAASDATLDLSDAATGQRLGTVTVTALPGGGGRMIPATVLPAQAGIAAAALPSHFNVKIEGRFTGYIQHLIRNQSGLIADMTPVCNLAPAPQPLPAAFPG